MDEITAIKLTPIGLADMEAGRIDDDEELLIMRALQSAEALEYPPREEEELEALLEWYETVQADYLLAKMMLEGNLFFARMEDGEPVWTSSPQGRALAVRTMREAGEEIPAWAEEDLPALD